MRDAPPTEAEIVKRLFHGSRLLKRADYLNMESAGFPLHAFRQATSLSEGVAISPLAHLALLTLNQPTVNRFMALRTALRHLVPPGLPVSNSPLSEMGLVTAAVNAELSTNQRDHVLSARANWGDVLQANGVAGDVFWQEVCVTLDRLDARQAKTRWKSMYGGSHLKILDQWRRWSDQTQPPIRAAIQGKGPPKVGEARFWPEASLPQQVRLVEERFLNGSLEVAAVLCDHTPKLVWLARHSPHPEAVADHLSVAVRAGLTHYLRHRVSDSGTVDSRNCLDDAGLVAAYDTLTERLGTWQDVAWESPALNAVLPKLLARHRAHAVHEHPLDPASPHRSARRRFRP